MDWKDKCRHVNTEYCGDFCVRHNFPVNDNCRMCSYYEPNLKAIDKNGEESF